MAVTTCWNCGARSTGPRCQWCGAAQTPDAPQGSAPYAANTPQTPASYGPGASAGQPFVSQASMSVRPPQPMGGAGAPPRGQFQNPPPGQPADWQNQRTVVSQPEGWQSSPMPPGQGGGWQSQPMQGYQQPLPGQPGNWQAQQPAPGPMSGWPGAQPPPGYQQPMPGQPPWPGVQQPLPGQAYPGMQPGASAARPTGAMDSTSLLLGVIGGLVGGIVGALIWAFILEATKTNISYIAVGLGFLVGLGVQFGARKPRSMSLALLGGVLGLLAFFLALYFRLSLLASDVLGEGTNLFALPVGDYFTVLGLYLQENAINYVYFVLVPLIAAGTAYGGQGQRRTNRRS